MSSNIFYFCIYRAKHQRLIEMLYSHHRVCEYLMEMQNIYRQMQRRRAQSHVWAAWAPVLDAIHH